MEITKATAIALLLLSINSVLGDSLYNSVFTKEIKLKNGRHPFKVDNKLRLLEYDTVVSTQPGEEQCKLSPFSSNLRSMYTLGNGKLLLVGESVTGLNVIDFKNCSSYVSTLISNDTYDEHSKVSDGYKLVSVVTYNDTFDVFDWYQKTCMPCRYNDKGERLQVKYPLEKEPTGQDPEWAYQHDGYSLEFVEDAFGVKNGYFYVFRYVNGTTALRILDSEFKVVKQRLFAGEVEAHSSAHGNLTVCRRVNACRSCAHVECHLFDVDLNSAVEVKLHQATDPKKLVHVQMKVQNLAGGGAIVAMQFQFGRSDPVHHKDVFIQRIDSSGRVDAPVQFDGVDNDFVFMHDFVFDNGEYCLVTVNDYYMKGSYTLIKCLHPKSMSDNRKVLRPSKKTFDESSINMSEISL